MFIVTEYSATTISFEITGTIDQTYDANYFDSTLYIATDFNLAEAWNLSDIDFSGTSIVDSITQTNGSGWRRSDNGSTTGYAFYFGALINSDGLYDVLLPIGTQLDIAITATGVFDNTNYVINDFGLYLGNAGIRAAQFQLASASEVPLPAGAWLFFSAVCSSWFTTQAISKHITIKGTGRINALGALGVRKHQA